MPDEPEGLRIARERIAKEKQERTGFLDLGKLGLQRWPEDLWKLKHLMGLNLGNGWIDHGKWRRAEADSAPNHLDPRKAYWSSLPSLEFLSINNMDWMDLRPLSGITSLKSLDCSGNRVTTLKPLAELPSLQSLRCADNRLAWLEGLNALTSLQFLDCSGNRVTTLKPLAGLHLLQSLECRSNLLTTLEPLTGLAFLESLDCRFNRLTTLEPLKGLSSLQSLVCHSNRLTTLKPLAGLTSLQFLDCSLNGLSTLEPLAGLISLQSLYCAQSHLATLEPLAGLSDLRVLNCAFNQLTTLKPLAALSLLRSLDCSGNQLITLRPLAELSALKSLNCAQNHLTDLEPLVACQSLQLLVCSQNQLPTLESLQELASLQYLDCWSNPLERLPAQLVWRQSLKTLILDSAALDGIPAEALSQNREDNCLPRLRAHFRDLERDGVLLPDVKVMVLGNGRTGKTQLCNRLRGQPFEENADTTHSITVTSQQFGPDIILRLWDFGGQDIYHGTHALFMRSRAVFVLLWTPDSEDSETHEHGGMTFRNHPLAWWQSFVRHMAGPENPVILVHSRCGRPEDRRLRLPVTGKELEELEAFPFCQVLNYSAFSQRGKAALGEALREAVTWLREKQRHSRIGVGRLAVQNRLEAMLAEDNPQLRPRTLSMERYEQICEECGDVSSPALLLEYLHLSGIVLHQPGLFGNRIILDQRWALEAVYTVLNRSQCHSQLRWLNGRFTRSMLKALVWQNHTEEEQRLFLDLMLSCGVCFIHRQGNEGLGLETEYIALDLLPGRNAVADELAARWRDGPPFDEAVVELPFAHPGVMRALLSRIGNLAGMAPIYWRDGVCLHERTHRSHALIEQRLEDRPPVIVIRTREGESMALLEELARWVRNAAEQSGLVGVHARLPESASPAIRTGAASTIPNRQSLHSLIMDTIPPSETMTYAVSYAWNDKSKETVDRLCREAEARGIRIMRDVTHLGLGERLSRFMTSLAGQDRVFVILSDAYLRSENCMFELSEIWRLCQQDDSRFHERVRVFRLPDAPIYDFGYQLEIIEHWGKQYRDVQERVAALAKQGLSTDMLQRFNNLDAFARSAGRIIPYIADRLLPKDFEDFVAHGFTDNSSASAEDPPAPPASQPPPRIAMSQKQRILFLAANPTNECRLALDAQCREIEARIRAAEHRDLVELHSRFAVRPNDLLQYLQQHNPHIVHFSGHGSLEEEIILVDSDGRAKPVSTATITQLFRTFQDNIRVVVFNACYSRAQAEAVTGLIDCAVGMKQSIGDGAAIVFAAAFYQSIAFGRSVRTAFEAGKTAIMLEGIPEGDAPVLLTRAGVDASQIILARPNPL